MEANLLSPVPFSAHERQLIEMQARICQALSSAKRLEIVYALRDGELQPGELARLVESSMANVSQHLSVLKSLGIVTARKEGQAMYYRLSSQEILSACKAVRRVLQEQLSRQQTLLDE